MRKGRASVRRSKNRVVYETSGGMWINKRIDSLRATSVHHSLDDAEHVASVLIAVFGGGQLTIKNRDGLTIRQEDIPNSATAALN